MLMPNPSTLALPTNLVLHIWEELLIGQHADVLTIPANHHTIFGPWKGAH